MAAVLACGEGAALAHLSSVALFDCSRWPIGEPHVLVPRRHRPIEGITIHHCLGLDPLDITVFRGIPTTTVARMLVDLSASHTEYQVAYVINRAAWQARSTATQRSGPGRARKDTRERACSPAPSSSTSPAAPGPGATSRTGSSSWSRGFPVPLVNMEFLGYEVDFRWPDRRLAVEVDGNHTRPNDKRNDAGRDRVLREAGYTVVRFTGPELPSAPARLVRTSRGHWVATRRDRDCHRHL